MTAISPPVRQPPRRRLPAFPGATWILTAVASTAVVVLGWRGADFPAQLFRVELFRRVGFTLWNSQWYGGHATLTYSVIFAPLATLLTPTGVGILSAVAATACFEGLVVRHFGARARLGALWFATAMVANLVVGRLTFSLGFAFGLGAALALQRRKPTLAIVLALLTPLASPLAGAFLALAAAAWALGRRNWAFGAAIVGAAVAPVLVVAALYPSGGRFPFTFGGLVVDLLLVAAGLVLLPRTEQTLRTGLVLYAVACVVAFVVPTPLGGNITRLGMLVAGPILVAALWPRRAWLLVALAVPLVFWQWAPAVQGAIASSQDPSVRAAYYQPLLGYLRSLPEPPQRIEIPFTAQHWESVYVAPDFPLARGWERQLDLEYNPAFYDGTLTAATYHTWLLDNAVQYVALPDVPLDRSSRVEGMILARRQPYLQPVFRSAHWRVWKVRGATSIVQGPARLVRASGDTVVLAVSAPGDIVVRVHSSSHWRVTDGRACVAPGPESWTLVHADAAGRVTLHQELLPQPADRDCPTKG